MMYCSSELLGKATPGSDTPGLGASGKPQAMIDFRCDGNGKTFVARQFATYPYHLTRPFYLDKDWPEMATMYLTSISGGLVQGDRISSHVKVGPGVAAHVTDSAAAKIHTMDEDKACQSVLLEIQDGGHLEYIAEPIILFPRSTLELRTSITLGNEATAVYAESYLTHIPETETDSFERLFLECAVRDSSGRLLVLDRLHVRDGESLMQTPGLLGKTFAQGTVFLLGPGAVESLDGIREMLQNHEDIYAGASVLPEDAGLSVRFLAADGDSLRKCIADVWIQARQLMKGIGAVTRKK